MCLFVISAALYKIKGPHGMHVKAGFKKKDSKLCAFGRRVHRKKIQHAKAEGKKSAFLSP